MSTLSPNSKWEFAGPHRASGGFLGPSVRLSGFRVWSDKIQELAQRNREQALEQLREHFGRGHMYNLTGQLIGEIPDQGYKLVPWAAREIIKNNLITGGGVFRDEAGQTSWGHARDILVQATQWFDWSREHNKPLPEFNRKDFGFSELEHWVYEMNNAQSDGESGWVDSKPVYTWEDGWHMDQVGSQDLAREGELMGHCVGGYCSQVDQGDSTIYSLRDPKGQPHVTIEVSSTPPLNKGYGQTPWNGRDVNVVQVQGKQDTEPIPEYQAYVDDWFETLRVNGWELTFDDPDREPEFDYVEHGDGPYYFQEPEDYMNYGKILNDPYDSAYNFGDDEDPSVEGNVWTYWNPRALVIPHSPQEWAEHAKQFIKEWTAGDYDDDDAVHFVQSMWLALHHSADDSQYNGIWDRGDQRNNPPRKQAEGFWKAITSTVRQLTIQNPVKIKGPTLFDPDQFNQPHQTQKAQQFLDLMERMSNVPTQWQEPISTQVKNENDEPLFHHRDTGELTTDRYDQTPGAAYRPNVPVKEPMYDEETGEPRTRNEILNFPGGGYTADNYPKHFNRYDADYLRTPPWTAISSWKFAVDEDRSDDDGKWVLDTEGKLYIGQGAHHVYMLDSLYPGTNGEMSDWVMTNAMAEGDWDEGGQTISVIPRYRDQVDVYALAQRVYDEARQLGYKIGPDVITALYDPETKRFTRERFQVTSRRDMWWLPSKTAADIHDLANKALTNLWNREDMRKLWANMVDVEHEMGRMGEYALQGYYEQVLAEIMERMRMNNGNMKGNLNSDEPKFREQDDLTSNYWIGPLGWITKTLRGDYRDLSPKDQQAMVWRILDVAEKIYPDYDDYRKGLLFEQVLTNLNVQYPASYKIWPWFVKQLKNLIKEGFPYYYSWLDYAQWRHYVDIAGQAGELINELRQENRLPEGFDINQMDLQTIETWLTQWREANRGDAWEKRDIVTTLSNGWTIENVTTQNDLNYEGELMGHCVGGYCNTVQRGGTMIYSLRDPKGVPHATMEYRPVLEGVKNVGDPGHKVWKVQQIQGKGNAEPIDEYRAMIKEFNDGLRAQGDKVQWNEGAWHGRGRVDNDPQYLHSLRTDNLYPLRDTAALDRFVEDYQNDPASFTEPEESEAQTDDYGIEPVRSQDAPPKHWISPSQANGTLTQIIEKVFEGSISDQTKAEWARAIYLVYSVMKKQQTGGYPGNMARDWPPNMLIAEVITSWLESYEAWHDKEHESDPNHLNPYITEGIARVRQLEKYFSEMKSGEGLGFQWGHPGWQEDVEPTRVFQPEEEPFPGAFGSWKVSMLVKQVDDPNEMVYDFQGILTKSYYDDDEAWFNAYDPTGKLIGSMFIGVDSSQTFDKTKPMGTVARIWQAYVVPEYRNTSTFLDLARAAKQWARELELPVAHSPIYNPKLKELLEKRPQLLSKVAILDTEPEIGVPTNRPMIPEGLIEVPAAPGQKPWLMGSRRPALHFPDTNTLAVGEMGHTHAQLSDAIKEMGYDIPAEGWQHEFNDEEPEWYLPSRWQVSTYGEGDKWGLPVPGGWSHQDAFPLMKQYADVPIMEGTKVLAIRQVTPDQMKDWAFRNAPNPAQALGTATAFMAYDPEMRVEAEQVYEQWKENELFVQGWNTEIDALEKSYADGWAIPPAWMQSYREEFNELRQKLGKTDWADEALRYQPQGYPRPNKVSVEKIPDNMILGYQGVGFRGQPVRLAIREPDVNSTHPYFKDNNLAAFLDFFIDPDNLINIGFMNTAPEREGRGYARLLIQALYDQYPEYTVRWGKLMDDAMVHLQQDFQKVYPDRTSKLGFFKIAPDINELAAKMIKNLEMRQDMIMMRTQWLTPDGKPANTDGTGTLEHWENQEFVFQNPKYNPELYKQIMSMLTYLPAELFKFFPWVVKMFKSGVASDGAMMNRQHVRDILTQAWQHMEYLRSQPPGSPNAAPIPDINQLDFKQLEEWVYARNATGIDVRPGFEWEYTEGSPGTQHNVAEGEGHTDEYPYQPQAERWDVGDGYTVWPVWTEADLAKEGELMGHCVGGYCRGVHNGESLIFSLRDAKGEPHVTMELEPDSDGYNIVQVQGKANNEPEEKYKEKVRSFFQQLKQRDYNPHWSIKADTIYDLDDYEYTGMPSKEYGVPVTSDIDLSNIARELAEEAQNGSANYSAVERLQEWANEGLIDRRDLNSEIQDRCEEIIQDRVYDLQQDWEQRKNELKQEWEAELDYIREENEDDEEEPDLPDFDEWLENNYPDEATAADDGFEDYARQELTEVDELESEFSGGHYSSWKMATIWKNSLSLPAQYTPEDPLDLEGKQPVFQNMQSHWWELSPREQEQAVVNAFRATMLSPRLQLKMNAIMYQEMMHIPAEESDPDTFEDHARALKERWDRQGQGDLMGEVEPLGWETQVPGKLIPGFWGNIRRLAALGPYAKKLTAAALDDLQNNGGKGDKFRHEVLKMGIPGVGPKVASFAWLALNPTGSDLGTMDVWMMRHLNQDQDSPNNPNHYFQLENQLRDEKDAFYGPDVPLGQYQWGVWDKLRTPGYHQDHSPLRVHEPTPYTDVAWGDFARGPRPQRLPQQHPEQQQMLISKTAGPNTGTSLCVFKNCKELATKWVPIPQPDGPDTRAGMCDKHAQQYAEGRREAPKWVRKSALTPEQAAYLPTLYHGTFSENVPHILEQGLLPRDQIQQGGRPTEHEWSPDVMPMPGHVYLKTFDDPYEVPGRETVLKIDPTKLDPTKFVTDEDLHDEWGDDLWGSLGGEAMNGYATLAYNGVVPPEAIEVHQHYDEHGIPIHEH